MAIPATSRSALSFQRRNGLLPTWSVPSPRQVPCDLKIHHMPLDQRRLDPELMLDQNGDPPPDRGVTDPWPPPQEVFNDEPGSASASS